jgi:hypothetical protein
MITILLIVHGLLAVALLGAVTHQALSVARRAPAGAHRSFVGKFSGVGAANYTNAIIVLFVVTSIGGALLYPQYRLDVRPALEDLNMRQANGAFEIKEHLAAIGLGLLPVYWVYWRQPLSQGVAATRRYLTWILAFLVWWNFLVGHVLNNIKGFGQ